MKAGQVRQVEGGAVAGVHLRTSGFATAALAALLLLADLRPRV